MLKRSLFAVALAASTLLVTGTVTGTGHASAPSVCSSAQPNPGLCKWRDDGCYYCYSYKTATWEQQYCNGGSGE
ncbi:hypothetical protein DQ384_21585 [Sphaerisporangium album]|uniref:Uncharacterized protein n=1 Tax=Sphaerisporangium album TaxID=509200 RepID=A0A367FGC6_9ACTN|nr:hypothetical protein [Sphaerisporangium album]RCG28959.1 hypothetical protein DQ384_21585 [Sphaerisporangium album]